MLAAPVTAPVFENETPDMELVPESAAPDPLRDVNPLSPASLQFKQ